MVSSRPERQQAHCGCGSQDASEQSTRRKEERERERETTHHSGAGGSSDRLFLCRWSYQQQETKELMGNADCRSSTSLRGARPVAVSEFTTGAEWACAAHGDRLSVCAAG